MQQPFRILLAEDTLASQLVAKKILEKSGYVVATAENGHQAIALWEQGPFDLILMDVQMPEMDGFSATGAIRARERETDRPPIPIIALTAHATQGDRDRCLQAGMNAYLSKPIEPDELLRMIATIRAQRGAALPADSEDSPAPELSATIPAEVPQRWGASSLLVELDGDLQLVKKLIGYFQQDSQTLLVQIRQGIAAREPAAVVFAAHRLRGLIRNFETAEAARIAGEIEECGRNAALERAEQLCPALERELARVTAEVEAFSASL